METGPAPLNLELTGKLKLHNRVEIVLTSNEAQLPRLSGEVRIAIERN